MTPHQGICYLVGAGPGDPGLLTVRGRELIQRAEVLVYDYLANPLFLSWAPESCEQAYVGKKANQHTLTQDEINALIVGKVKAGKLVVRLKGGDPFVFGRGGEEAEALRKEGLKFEVVPGVTSGVAAPAYAGIPVTHRDFTSSVTFVTGHEEPGKAASAVNWKALAELRNTLVMYMGVQRLETNLNELMKHGLPSGTPAAAIRWGTTPRQKQIMATVGTLAREAVSAGLAAPAIIVIGAVASCSEELSWFADRPLFGKKIIVTRSRRQSGKLRGLLEEQGAEVWEWPMIRTRHILPEAGWKQYLQKADWVFFTSPNGVGGMREAVEAAGGDARILAEKRLGIVGPSTREALGTWGLRADFMPAIYTAEGMADGWLREYGSPKKQTIFFAAGSEAGNTLEQKLERAGHAVDRVHFYRTEPERDLENEARAFVEQGAADWVVFNSSSAVKAFADLGVAYAANLKWASFGQATTEALGEMGIRNVECQAPESTLESLVAELIRVELTSSPSASH